MPSKRVRLTKDVYNILLKSNNLWEQVLTFDNLVDAVGYVHTSEQQYGKEFVNTHIKVVKKRVPNTDAHTVYYVMYQSPQGYTQARASSLTVEKAERDLALYRLQFPNDTNKFFVRKRVEMK